ncbi:MAG: dTDP-4-dehydrorhamnose reductase [Chlamydiae bacterium]|nr:dTDP-4-dehydrorhamnose reductase [Chlamydiota bacterium]
MLIWIVGSNGFVGSLLSDAMRKRRIPFVETTRRDVDITKRGQIENFFSRFPISHFINCAGYTNVELAEKQQDEAYDINVKGTLNLGSVAKKHGAKILHLSTDYVFDGAKQTPYLETDICNPLSIYGKTKFEGEKQLLKIEPSASILRTSWLFGKGGKTFISSIFNEMKKCEIVSVLEDQVSKPTYSMDLIEAILKLIESSPSGIFHFANQEQCSRFEVALEIKKLAKKYEIEILCKEIKPILTKELNLSAIRPKYSALDTEKIASYCKIKLRNWKEGLEEYIRNEKTI